MYSHYCHTSTSITTAATGLLATGLLLQHFLILKASYKRCSFLNFLDTYISEAGIWLPYQHAKQIASVSFCKSVPVTSS